MIFKIYQIEDIDKCEYSFMGYEYALKHNFNLYDYEQIFLFTENTLFVDDAENRDVYELLELVYRMFNRVTEEDTQRLHFIGYKGRSISTSDIVEVDGTKYYCDTTGWKEIN